MGLLELFILAVGLSMDAFAVSVCKGLSLGKIRFKHMATAGLWFGGFQALMPTIGFLLGRSFADMVTKYAHWIAFVLLVLIGANMLKEALSGEEEEPDADASMSAKKYVHARDSYQYRRAGGRRYIRFSRGAYSTRGIFHRRGDIRILGGGNKDRQHFRRQVQD